MWKNAPAGDDQSKSYSGVVDNGSRWGIKGSHELSDGLNAVYQFETKLTRQTLEILADAFHTRGYPVDLEL